MDSYSFCWGFYIAAAILLAAAVIAFLVAIGKTAEVEDHGKPPVSSADELAKFKDLLDKGIITQEEFDAKKKQLLGL